ncbi:hypothetical protein D9M69_523100 [compost metagenome]
MVGLDELRTIAARLAQVVGNMHSHQRLVLAMRTFGLRRLVQSAAAWAHLFVLEDFEVHILSSREHEASRYIFGKECAVEPLEVMPQLIRAGFLNRRAPTRGMALSAMNHRQMQAGQVRLAQVIMVTQSRFRIQYGHHAAQLTQPDLDLHLQEETLMPWLTGVRHQGQQTGQP